SDVMLAAVGGQSIALPELVEHAQLQGVHPVRGFAIELVGIAEAARTAHASLDHAEAVHDTPPHVATVRGVEPASIWLVHTLDDTSIGGRGAIVVPCVASDHTLPQQLDEA